MNLSRNLNFPHLQLVDYIKLRTKEGDVKVYNYFNKKF
jgi:hypothetical protein